MGTHATLLVEMEKDIMLFPQANPNQASAAPKGIAVTVNNAGAGKPALDASASTGVVDPARALATGQAALAGTPSRGYREEMEDFAYCVRMWDQANKAERRLPRCHGRVAMADAIVALTSNVAMRKRERIVFRPEWFQVTSDEVPDPDKKPTIIS